MPVNFLKTAFRHFAQNKLYVVLNVFGLAIGVSCLLLAILYWKMEYSFDSFHSKKDQIFRITTTLTARETGERSTTGETRQVQGPAFKSAVPEILEMTRLLGGDIFGDVRHENTVLNLQMLFVDESFFEIFDFELLHGNRTEVLKEINSVVLSEETAMRFFNSTDVVGKLLFLDADPSAEKLGKKPMTVAGVAKKLPSNSSIGFDILMPLKFMQLSFEDPNWLGAYLGTFVVLKENTDLQTVAQKFNQIHNQFAAPEIAAEGFDPQQVYGLQPLADIHLNSFSNHDGWNENGTLNTSQPIYSNLFLGIAFFIFGLASINFVNISIAGSLKRAKEVGIRKINGSSRRGILLHFLGESALLCGFAFGLALVFADLVLPAFNNLADTKITLAEVFDWKLAVGFFVVLCLNILLSGFYPAILLSNFKPTETLYNRNRPIGQRRLGKILVVVQFSLAVILMLATVVFYAQMEFIRSKNLGFDPSFVLHTGISGDRDYETPQKFLKNEVAKYPFFEGIAFGGGFGNDLMETKIGDKKVLAAYFSTDQNYLSVLGHELIFGKNFTKENSREIIVNQAFVRESGLENPLGQFVQLNPDYSHGSAPFQIVGVIKDYHFESLRHKIQPMVMYQNVHNTGGIWLKINKLHTQSALKTFEKLYREAVPGAVYNYDFLDDLNAKNYARELRWQKIITIFAVISLLICCLGLFGLAHLNAGQRTKEIGIRKILGASVASISNLLVGDFLKLVIISIFVGSPLAFYFMKKWLSDFAYRVDIQWWMFVLAGAAAVGIAILTVSLQSVKAALANPVKSLRSE